MSKSPEGEPLPSLPIETLVEAGSIEGEHDERPVHKSHKPSKKTSKEYSNDELLSQLDIVNPKDAGHAMDIAIEEDKEARVAAVAREKIEAARVVEEKIAQEKAVAEKTATKKQKPNVAPRVKGFGSTEAGDAAIAEELRVEGEMADKIDVLSSVLRKHKPKKYLPKKDLKKMTAEEFGEHVRTKNHEMMMEEEVGDTAEKEKELERVRFHEALDVARARKQEIKDRYETEKIKQEAIEAANSFDELFEALGTGKGILGKEKKTGEQDYFNTALLKSIITSVRNRELGDPADGEQQGIEYVTRSEGLRDKVFALLQAERQATSTPEAVVSDEPFDSELSEVQIERTAEAEVVVPTKKTPPLIPKKLVPPPLPAEAVILEESFDSELSDVSVTELPEDTLRGKLLQFKEEGSKRKIKKKGVASMLTEANEMPLGKEAQIRIAEQELVAAQTEHAKIVAEVMDVRHRMANYGNSVLSWFSRITGSEQRNKVTYQKLIAKEKEALTGLQEMEDRIKTLKGEVM